MDQKLLLHGEEQLTEDSGQGQQLPLALRDGPALMKHMGCCRKHGGEIAHVGDYLVIELTR